MYNLKLLTISDTENAKKEIEKLNVDKISINLMAPKAVFLTIKIENLPSYGANIIKQEMLSKGGEAAVSKNAVNCSEDKADAMIMGTVKQIDLLIKKLRMQPKSLRILGEELETLINGIKKKKHTVFKTNKHTLPLGEKTYIMGILNITPDSFSDGGDFINPEAALERALNMIKEGADIIDIGGESTRPGHIAVSPEEELQRVIPCVEAIVKETDIPVSIDTAKAMVALEAVKAGANIINDIWGLQKDSGLVKIASKYKTGIIAMHNNTEKEYDDIINHINSFLRKSIQISIENEIDQDKIVLDPGIGFGKTPVQNLEVMSRLEELRVLSYPLLLGTSRKSMIGHVLDLPVNERLEGSLATCIIGAMKGFDFVRVHDVKETKKALMMADAIIRRQYG
jgi:dihydropteroate synthase